MTKPKTPCYGCKKRTVRCHGDCKEYMKYKAQLDAYNAEHVIVWQDWRNMKPAKKNVKRLSG